MGVRVVFPDMGKDPSIQLIEKTITENGTYDAITDGANGYSKVNVNVEGGGGESDFSTAQVTVVSTRSASTEIIMPTYYETDGEHSSQSCGDFYYIEGTNIVPCILYKGVAVAIIPYSDPQGDLTVNIEGNIRNDGDDLYYITGDCTITIS